METNQIVTIMDIDFINKTKDEFLQDCVYPHLNNEEKCFIVTANPEIVMKTREDKKYKEVVHTADYVIPDGIGIVKASRWMKQPLKERVAGFDVVLDILTYADKHRLSVFFLGAKEAVNKKAIEEVNKKYPNIEIAGRHHGYFELEDTSVMEMVKQSNADVVLVALGFPKQEFWIHNLLPHVNKGVFIGVGGTIDGLAGEVPRAPKFWVNLNLEWLYRIIKQPTRAKRILKAFEFMLRIILKKS